MNPLPEKNHRLLIVDDNRAIHDDFRKIFSPEETSFTQFESASAALFGEEKAQCNTAGGRCFQLDSAYQGQEGLAQVHQALAEGKPYAMAFVDVRMPPGWDGVETTAKIWEVDPDLQIVICTAYSDYSWNDMLQKLGQSERLIILKKPFDPVEVLQLANSLVQKWQRLQDSKDTVTDLVKTVAARTAEVVRGQEMFKEIFENSPEGIFQIAPDGSFLVANPTLAGIHGYASPNEMLEHLTDVRSQRYFDPQRFGELQRRLEREKVVREFESEIKCKDGSRKWISESVCKVAAADGSTLYYQGFVLDISAQKEAQRQRNVMEVQLRQAQKLEAIGQLAAGIAHEINTPTQYVGDNTRFLQDSFQSLQPILQSHQELLQGARNNSLTPELLARAEQTLAAGDLPYLFAQIPAAIGETLEGVARISKIVRAMKEFSHPGGQEKSPADLNRAIESTVTVAHNEWKYVAEMKLDLDPELPPVPCFLGEFNQIILNLVVNAAHAIGDVTKRNPGAKGLITICTCWEAGHIEVRVGDTGSGIAEANRPHIFEPFFTTKEVGKGTGQGLSIVYGSVVKKHGGSVRFETELGKGTTFIIQLPLAPPAVEPLPATSPYETPAFRG
jgi:two-component system NtrC family sensor kinase